MSFNGSTLKRHEETTSAFDMSYFGLFSVPPLLPAEFFVNLVIPPMLMMADPSDENMLIAPAERNARNTCTPYDIKAPLKQKHAVSRVQRTGTMGN